MDTVVVQQFMKTKVTIEMNVCDFKKLADFLTDHETEIATHTEDYGDLWGLFESVYEEHPVCRRAISD